MTAAFARACVLACGALVACGRHEPAPAPSARLDDAVATQVVASETVADERGWDGVVAAVRHADLAAQTGGRVADALVDIDDRVAQGQVLLRITAVEQQADEVEARATLRAADAGLVQAGRDAARVEALVAKGLASAAARDRARTDRDAARAARDAARAALARAGQQAIYTVVRAPFDGVVAARAVEPGETIAPGQLLLSLHAPAPLRVDVHVPPSDAVAIRAAGRADIRFDDGRHVGVTDFTVAPAADARTHAVTVRLPLPPLEPPPMPGAIVRVAFPSAARAAVVFVPAATIVQRGDVSAVYVRDAAGLSLRQVRVGRAIGDRVEVTSGLSPGEHIATDPVAALQALVAGRAGRARG